jgi:hypothetical protein
MFQFKTRDDFQKMVDAQVEETLTLDYKASTEKGVFNATLLRKMDARFGSSEVGN